MIRDKTPMLPFRQQSIGAEPMASLLFGLTGWEEDPKDIIRKANFCLEFSRVRDVLSPRSLINDKPLFLDLQVLQTALEEGRARTRKGPVMD